MLSSKNPTAIQNYFQVEGKSKGSYSDISLHALGHTYSLHRLILAQSPVLKQLMDAHSSPILNLALPEESSLEAVDIILSYLYDISGVILERSLTPSNALPVLVTASALHLQDACQVAQSYILNSLTPETVLSYTRTLSSLRRKHGAESWINRLDINFFSFLCVHCHSHVELVKDLDVEWIHRLFKSDFLLVKNEFERYDLLKRVLEDRSTLWPKVSVEKPKRWFERMLPATSASVTETTSSDLLVDAIHYSFLSFSELDTVKRDGLVPIQVVHGALWNQTQLTNLFSGTVSDIPSLPCFRFTVLFKDLFKTFQTSMDAYSEPIDCANVRFRVVLHREDDFFHAELQSDGDCDTHMINYRVYAWKGKNGEDWMNAITECLVEDEVSKQVELCEEVELLIVVNFVRVIE